MGAVKPATIERLMQIAKTLPQPQQQQLTELVASWREVTRYAPREAFSDLVPFKSARGVHYGRARDVSPTGLFLATSESFRCGERVELMLTMIAAPNPIQLTGTISRVTRDGIAIAFDLKQRSQIRELETIIAKHAAMTRQS